MEIIIEIGTLEEINKAIQKLEAKGKKVRVINIERDIDIYSKLWYRAYFEVC